MEYTYEVIESEEGSVVKRTDPDGKEWWIPTDPANSDYQEYLASLEATPAKAPKTTVVEEPVAPEEE
jgi:hypothetical protein